MSLLRTVEHRHLAPEAALRSAQLAMMKDPRWSQPYYWAAFTIHAGTFRYNHVGALCGSSDLQISICESAGNWTVRVRGGTSAKPRSLAGRKYEDLRLGLSIGWSGHHADRQKLLTDGPSDLARKLIAFRLPHFGIIGLLVHRAVSGSRRTCARAVDARQRCASSRARSRGARRVWWRRWRNAWLARCKPPSDRALLRRGPGYAGAGIGYFSERAAQSGHALTREELYKCVLRKCDDT